MDRAALARELFDLHAGMRSEVWVLKMEAGLAGPDLSGRVAAGSAKLSALIERAEAIVAGYCASADSGAHRPG